MFKAAHEMLSERVRTSESERERLAAELGATPQTCRPEMCRDSASSSQPFVTEAFPNRLAWPAEYSLD